MRELSHKFTQDLQFGHLSPLLNLIKRDQTLCLQIRNAYLNIYYRGGSILKLEETRSGYNAIFDTNYLKLLEESQRSKIVNNLPTQIDSIEDSNLWVESIPLLKQSMDFLFSRSSKCEREFQQLVARENNNSAVSNDTDYFITDIEYTPPKSEGCRFDMIAINWLAIPQDRQSGKNCKIALIEMKYGDGAFGGISGISKHIEDVDKFCADGSKLEILKKETISGFKKLRELGLIRFGNGGNNNQIDLVIEKPELILLFANHKPNKKELLNEIKKIGEVANVDVKIGTSSLMGYGLYTDCMTPLKEFQKNL